MRSSLALLEGQHLMCRGLIRHWIDHVDSGVRQVTVGNPVFKAFNPLKCFTEQEALAREDHVNLFIPYSHLPSYDTKFCLLENISFHGYVSSYRRSNGSLDYGINSTPQNETLRKLQKIRAQIAFVYTVPDSSSLALIENVLLPLIDELILEIDKLGDSLPTFTMTRNQMIDDLTFASKFAKGILTARSSRQFRRKEAHKSKKKSSRFPPALFPSF